MSKFKFYHPALDGLDYEPIFLEYKNVVCPACDGEGYHFRSDIDGQEVEYLNQDLDLDLEEDDLNVYRPSKQRFTRYHQKCECCKGNRVIKSYDESELPKWVLKLINEHELQMAVWAAEKAFGC